MSDYAESRNRCWPPCVAKWRRRFVALLTAQAIISQPNSQIRRLRPIQLDLEQYVGPRTRNEPATPIERGHEPRRVVEVGSRPDCERHEGRGGRCRTCHTANVDDRRGQKRQRNAGADGAGSRCARARRSRSPRSLARHSTFDHECFARFRERAACPAPSRKWHGCRNH